MNRSVEIKSPSRQKQNQKTDGLLLIPKKSSSSSSSINLAFGKTIPSLEEQYRRQQIQQNHQRKDKRTTLPNQMPLTASFLRHSNAGQSFSTSKFDSHESATAPDRIGGATLSPGQYNVQKPLSDQKSFLLGGCCDINQKDRGAGGAGGGGRNILSSSTGSSVGGVGASSNLSPIAASRMSRVSRRDMKLLYEKLPGLDRYDNNNSNNNNSGMNVHSMMMSGVSQDEAAPFAPEDEETIRALEHDQLFFAAAEKFIQGHNARLQQEIKEEEKLMEEERRERKRRY